MKTISISKDKYLLYGFEADGCHIIPPHYQPKKFSGDTILWLLPANKNGKSKKIECGNYTVKAKRKEIIIEIQDITAEKEYAAVPCKNVKAPFSDLTDEGSFYLVEHLVKNKVPKTIYL